MRKKIFIFLVLVFVLVAVVCAHEKVWQENSFVLTYLYSKNCYYCKRFDPIFDRLVNSGRKDIKFEKVDIDTAYGISLAKKWRVRYVPFVAVTKNDSNKVVELEPSCAVNLACANNIIDNFAK